MVFDFDQDDLPDIRRSLRGEARREHRIGRALDPIALLRELLFLLC
jgi:hypothetical protein